MFGTRQSRRTAQREGYNQLEAGEEQDGQDTLGRSTRLSIAPGPRRWARADWEEEQVEEPLTLGFAAGKAAAERLKKALAERIAPASRTGFERADSMGKSKAQKITRTSSGASRASAGPGQMALRQRDKFVPLPDSLIGVEEESMEQQQDLTPSEHAMETSSAPTGGAFAMAAAEDAVASGRTPEDSLFGDLAPLAAPLSRMDRPQMPSPTSGAGPRASLGPDSASRGRITVYCMAESLDRKTLIKFLQASYKTESIHQYMDVLHLRIDEVEKNPVPDAFFFDYGVIICWGLDEKDEKNLVKSIGKVCEVGPYLPEDVEIDEFQFNYSANEPPHIQNDMITINKRQASDHQVRLAISHALAQSIKLSMYEAQVMELVEETKDLPESLAKFGKVDISSKKVAKLIGKVFLQSSTVNLLSSVLDTPEYFWYAPDSLQALYERACEYLELETRVEVLNARFQVLQEMLDMLRDHKNNAHASRLEWIIIWLLVVDVMLMILQLMGLFGFV